MTQNVRLQNLRDFTVQILHTETEATIGTGIAVSMDGRILTCAHVVRDAGVDPRLEIGKEVGVYFQFLRGGEQKKRCAVVEKFFSESDDDIVQLKLTDGPAPLAPEQMPKLGRTWL
jgi:hypothetical protein